MISRLLSIVLPYRKRRVTLDPAGVRAHRRLLEKLGRRRKPDPTVQREKIHIGSLAASWFLPQKHDPRRVVLYLHGGGFNAGSPDSHHDLISRIAKASRSRVLAPAYRLSPEHRFPAALNDATAAYAWLLDQGHAARNLAVAGDSAGGGLSLSLLLNLRETGRPLPAAAVLLSPWTDLAATGRSMKTRDHLDPMLDKQIIDACARLYADEDQFSTPLASPVNADLTGLCPLLIQVGALEVLLDDSVRIADHARKNGVTVVLEQYEHMFHVFQFAAAVLPQGRKAIKRIGSFLRHHFSQT